MAAATMKHAELVSEVKALGGLVKDVTQRENETRRQVAAIDSRMAILESGMRTLDDTVSGMGPLLEKNTDLTFRTAQDVISTKADVAATKQDVAGIKIVVDQIGPDIGDLKKMITAQQDREAARRWWVGVRKFSISTGGFFVMIATVFSTIGGGFWWLWTHFKLVAP
jgi:hypothetical protein